MQFVNLAEIAENNKKMLERYPFVWPSREGRRLAVPEFNFTTTMMDTMPRGYLIAFGDRFLEDVLSCLVRENAVDAFLIVSFGLGGGRLQIRGNCEVRGLREVFDVYEYLSERTCAECGAEAKCVGVTFEGSTKGRGTLPHCFECRDRIHLDEILRGFSPTKFVEISLPEWIREIEGRWESFDGNRWNPAEMDSENVSSGVDTSAGDVLS